MARVFTAGRQGIRAPAKPLPPSLVESGSLVGATACRLVPFTRLLRQDATRDKDVRREDPSHHVSVLPSGVRVRCSHSASELKRRTDLFVLHLHQKEATFAPAVRRDDGCAMAGGKCGGGATLSWHGARGPA